MATATARTNSLAFAKADCHTCAQLDEECDRRRPKCGTCLSQKRRCGGFAMNLVWKDPSINERRDSSTADRIPARPRPKPAREIKIIQGYPKKRRKTKEKRSNLGETFIQEFGFALSPPSSQTCDQLPEPARDSDHSTPGNSDHSTDASDQFDFGAIQYWPRNSSESQLSAAALPDQLALLRDVGNDHEDVELAEIVPSNFGVTEENLFSYPLDIAVTNIRPMDYFLLSSGILYEDLTQKYGPLLSMCEHS